MIHKIKNKENKSLRRLLMGGGVAVVAAAALIAYLIAGRYIETDNAYIKSAKIMITPEVSGVIESVAVSDNQIVHKGDVLFKIDPAAYEIAVQRAEADLLTARTRVEEMKANYRQKLADIERAQAVADYSSKSYNRTAALVRSGAVSQEAVDERSSSNATAQKDVAMLREDLNAIVAELNGNPDIAVEDHPSYKAALAALNNAKLNLERTTIKAPVDGLTGNAARAGDYARASVPAMSMVGTNEYWIEANFKETELTNVLPGQPVEIKVDTYPGRRWSGKVESISPATGSEFSVLPAQNATGNWVKVVQRIAVRIAIEPQKDAPDLRAGMSTNVTIDIGHYPHLKG